MGDTSTTGTTASGGIPAIWPSGSSSPFRETDVPGVLLNQETGVYVKDGRVIPFSEYRALLSKWNAENDTSGKVSASVAAQTGLGYAQLGENARQFDAQFTLQQQQIEQQIREWNKQYALDLQKLGLQRDQLALAERQGRREEARGLATAIADQQGRMNDNLIQLSQIKNQAAQLNSQMQFQASEGNANRRFQAAQAAADRTMSLLNLTEQMRSRNIDQQIEIAGQIADYSKDPGDIVANIAAQQQFGSISTALGNGFNGLNEDALRPLGLMIQNQDSAKAEGSRLANQSSGLSAALQNTLSPTYGVQDVQAPTYTPETPNLQSPDIMGLFNQILGTLTDTNQQQAQPQQQVTAGWSQDANGQWHGPVQFGQTVTGNSGGYMRTLPAGVAEGGMDNLPSTPGGSIQKLAYRPDGTVDTGTDATKFADGGVGLFNVPTTVQVAENGPEALMAVSPDSINRARELLLNAFRPAFERFRAAAPGIPSFDGGVTPVGVSAPGTDPMLQQAAAGLTAAGSGVKQESFFNDLNRSRATGINPGVVRRAI